MFKRAFEDFLPQPILTRKKLEFNVPFAVWFREGHHDRPAKLLLSDRACDRGLLKAGLLPAVDKIPEVSHPV